MSLGRMRILKTSVARRDEYLFLGGEFMVKCEEYEITTA
jgi:hypothetical protein